MKIQVNFCPSVASGRDEHSQSRQPSSNDCGMLMAFVTTWEMVSPFGASCHVERAH